MLNNVILMGRLTSAPEIKTTQNEKNYVKFCLAVNRGDKDNNADFINCIAWGKTAEFICNYFQKGSMLALEGCLRTSVYEKDDGTKRKNTEVLINRVHFTGEYSKQENLEDETTAAFDGDDYLPF